MAENFVDFRAIKQSISIMSVLDRYGIGLRKVNPNSLRGLCPLPTHNSKTSTESFGVNTAKNIWACQSDSCAAARGGRKGGNILDFVSIMERCSIREAAEKLQEWSGAATASSRNSKRAEPVAQNDRDGFQKQKKKLDVNKKGTAGEEKSDVAETNEPLTFTLKDVDPSHPYVRSRGIKEEVAREFGVGYFPGRGSMAGRVVIPISNAHGELVAYAGRSIDGSDPKYKLPTGFQKSLELFNLHRTVGKRDRVILVEGFFDAMKVHQAGIPEVVALMGCSLSDLQEKLLAPFKSIVIFLDGDTAGKDAAKGIVTRLVHSYFVKSISLPEGKQPDQLSSGEIRKYLEP